MKIRSSYVSNSSSSSFLIIYKKPEDFSKFSQFEEFGTFYHDLNEAPIESGLKHLKVVILNSLYNVFECMKNFQLDISSATNDIFDIFRLAEMDYKEFAEIEIPVIALIDEYRKKIAEKNPGLLNILYELEGNYMNSPFISEEQIKFILNCEQEANNKFHSEEFWNQLKESAENLAKKIYNIFEKKGYKLRSIRYEDDTNIGCFMETGFMPFISMNPEREYEIITTNEH